MTTTLPFPSRTAAIELNLAARAAVVIAMTGLMALAAHFSVPLPFSPVPLALTPFAVLLIGMILAPVEAVAVMVLYLLEGAAGLPVFTPMGPGGLAQIFGPTGGFLLSYAPAAAAVGWLVRRLPLRQALGRGLVAGGAATCIIFLCGAGWLAGLLHLGAAGAWHLAVAPFVPGEALKIVVAALVYETFHRQQNSTAAPQPEFKDASAS